MEITENQITLREFHVGSRILIRSKKDWRVAVISALSAETVTLIVCSPSGRTYRLRCNLECEIIYDSKIPLLKTETGENWRDNFSKYDFRW